MTTLELALLGLRNHPRFFLIAKLLIIGRTSRQSGTCSEPGSRGRVIIRASEGILWLSSQNLMQLSSVSHMVLTA